MKKIVLLFAVLLMMHVAVVSSVSAQSAPAPTNTTLVKVGEPVPAFTVTMFDGQKINIEELKGKVVLVNFWATWCGPCRAEFKRVPQEILEQFKDQDFVFLPISREDPYDKIKAFREQTGYTFPMGTDYDRKIYSLFATSSIPRNFLVNKAGEIVLCEEEYTPEQFDHLIATIKKELKK